MKRTCSESGDQNGWVQHPPAVRRTGSGARVGVGVEVGAGVGETVRVGVAVGASVGGRVGIGRIGSGVFAGPDGSAAIETGAGGGGAGVSCPLHPARTSATSKAVAPQEARQAMAQLIANHLTRGHGRA